MTEHGAPQGPQPEQPGQPWGPPPGWSGPEQPSQTGGPQSSAVQPPGGQPPSWRPPAYQPQPGMPAPADPAAYPASGYGEPSAVTPPPQRGRNKWKFLAPAAVIVLAGAGVGAYALTASSSSSAPAALASSVPADSIVFAQANLGRLDSLNGVLSKIPNAPTINGDDPLGSLLGANGQMASGMIGAWLGDRVGVAVVPTDSTNGASFVIVAESTDDAKAKQTIDSFASMAGFAGQVSDGHVYLAQKASDVTATLDSLRQHGSLAGSADFTPYADEVADDAILSGYVDIEASKGPLAKLVQRFGSGVLGQADGSSLGEGTTPFGSGDASNAVPDPADLQAGLDALTGTATFSFRARGDDVAEVVTDSHGQKSVLDATPGESITHLPGDAVYAAELSDASDVLTAYWKNLSSGVLAGAEGQLRQAGLSFPAEIPAVAGTDAALAVSAGGSEEPRGGLVVAGGDPAAAEKLAGAVSESTGEQFTVYPQSGGYTISNSSDYADTLSTGDLGSNAKFQKVVPGAASNDFSAYMDAAKAGELDQESGQALEHVDAIGIGGTVDGANQHVVIRIAVR